MTKISMTALFIFMIIAISSCNNRVSAGTATYGSNLVKVSINTGNYPQEIRWAIYKIDNMDDEMKFLTDSEEKKDEINNILSDTNWELPVEELRPVRNQFCELVGVQPPVLLKKAL